MLNQCKGSSSSSYFVLTVYIMQRTPPVCLTYRLPRCIATGQNMAPHLTSYHSGQYQVEHNRPTLILCYSRLLISTDEANCRNHQTLRTEHPSLYLSASILSLIDTVNGPRHWTFVVRLSTPCSMWCLYCYVINNMYIPQNMLMLPAVLHWFDVSLFIQNNTGGLDQPCSPQL